MTSSELKKFKNSLHDCLKPTIIKSTFIIKEQDIQSSIKELRLTFKNKDDVCVIVQDPKNCPSITNIFSQKQTLNSCDFIVFLLKNTAKIYFCEIKSSLSKENYEKAIAQIKNSEVFFKYILESYCLNFDTKMEIEEVEYWLIYPSNMSQKIDKRQFDKVLIEKKIEIKDGVFATNNGYDFFNDK